MAWATLWAVAAPALWTLTSDERVVLPFAPISALGAALAIFVAFRNNAAFGRWSEARAAWQSLLVAGRVLTRQVVASTELAERSAAVDRHTAVRYRRRVAELVAAFGWLVAAQLRPTRVDADTARRAWPGLPAALIEAPSPPLAVLTELGVTIKEGIRDGALGQFDPISMEPQLVALNAAHGTVERIATTPTPRQYDYFGRRFIDLFALLLPFAIIGLVPTSVWWTIPLSLAVSGVFVMMSVTGAANDEPFAGTVTDVPLEAIATELERDVKALVGIADVPRPAVPVDGYLW
jgi:putative membrane protein